MWPFTSRAHYSALQCGLRPGAIRPIPQHPPCNQARLPVPAGEQWRSDGVGKLPHPIQVWILICYGAHPGSCRMCNSIPSLYLQGASSVTRHRQISPWGSNHPQLRTPVLCLKQETCLKNQVSPRHRSGVGTAPCSPAGRRRAATARPGLALPVPPCAWPTGDTPPWERDWGTLLLPATRTTSPLLRSPSALTPRPQLSAPERGLTPDGFSGHSWSSRELHSLTIHFPTWRKVRGSKGNNHRRRGARPGYVWLGPRNHRDSSIHAASQSGHGHDVKHQESRAQLMTGRVRHLTWL